MITSHHITAQLAAERQRELRAAGPAQHRWGSCAAVALACGTAAADERPPAAGVRPQAQRGATDQPELAHPPELRARRAHAAERRERIAG